jgi:hypothetical protein
MMPAYGVRDILARRNGIEPGDTYLVDANRFPPEFYLVHNLARVFRILFCEKLAKSVSLM